MIILDTNVVSEPLRVAADSRVIAWLDSHDPADLWLTAITAAELRAGVEKLDVGRRRVALADQVDAILGDHFAGRILPFGVEAALAYGVIVGPKLRSPQPIETLDYQIAAIARVHGATLATRNVRHFQDCGIELIDPWTA
jgi:toxin FitB